MVIVLKRSGKKQAFSKAKLERVIRKALKEGNVTGKKASDITKEIADGVTKSIKRKRVVKAVKIREMALGRLERRSKAAATAWKRYDKKKKR